MLDAIGLRELDELFDEIPQSLKGVQPLPLPPALREMEITRLMQARAVQDGFYLSFLGGGAYEHHIPAAIWQLATRGEFYSAYTPYQAEASQGTLQVLYEYQSMMCALTGHDVSNASLYDGASALAEAVLMAVRLHKGGRKILMPSNVSPVYRKVVRTITASQGVELVEIAFDAQRGCIDETRLPVMQAGELAAVVIAQPNYFGCLEAVHAITDWAHRQGALVIALVNPIALAMLAPPGSWGARGADIAIGEGQPLGVPLAGGGPYFGFMTCKAEYVRQMPGRVVGRTTDLDGRPGFTLTLQAREQHIRRSKATSNICTNQGLAVTAATLYMALLGPAGLRAVAESCHANLNALLERLAQRGIRPRFSGPHFHEAVLEAPCAPTELLEGMLAHRVLGGIDITDQYPALCDTPIRHGSLLVCATEVRTGEDLDAYVAAVDAVLGNTIRNYVTRP